MNLNKCTDYDPYELVDGAAMIFIVSGMDHDDVRNRAEQMIEESQGSVEESDLDFDEELHEQAKKILAPYLDAED